MQIGINLPSGQGHERLTSGVRRSKVKVTGGRSYIWKPGGDIILHLESSRQSHAVSNGNVAFERWWCVAHSCNCPPPVFVIYASCWRTCFVCYFISGISSTKTFNSLFEGKQDKLEAKIDVEHGLLSKLEADKVITRRHRTSIEVKFVNVFLSLLSRTLCCLLT